MKRKSDPRLSSLGEWGFLHRLLPRLRRLGGARFLVPPGDDAAVLRSAGRPVLSIDGLTENTHFRSSWDRRLRALCGVSLGRALAWKLLGSCLSDLAAMGDTRDRWAMIYLGAPGSTRVSFLEDMHRGMVESAGRLRCSLAGGDTVRSRDLTMVAAVGGRLNGRRALVRTGGQPGQLLCIAGTVGDASAGLAVLEGKGGAIPRRDQAYFVRRFFDVRPLFDAGAALAADRGVSCGMDVSDALSDCISILCRASGAGAEVDIERLPLSDAFARHFPATRALAGGEDYSLLFAADRPAVTRLRERLPITVIGRLTHPAADVHYYDKGRPSAAPAAFQHFT